MLVCVVPYTGVFEIFCATSLMHWLECVIQGPRRWRKDYGVSQLRKRARFLLQTTDNVSTMAVKCNAQRMGNLGVFKLRNNYSTADNRSLTLQGCGPPLLRLRMGAGNRCADA